MNSIPPVSLPSIAITREPTYHPSKVTTPDLKLAIDGAPSDALARFVADFGLHPAALRGAEATPPAEHRVSAAAGEEPLMDQAQSLKAESVQRERQAADADVNHKLDGLPKIFQW